MTRKRIGILTGGGDCPGLNAVIRAWVRTLIQGNTDVVGIQFGFEGLLTNNVVPLTHETIRGILPKGGTLLRTTNRGNPFEYPIIDDGKVRCIDRSAEVIENIRTLGIDGIVAIGGDGTLRIAQRLCDMGIPMVAVPKTIDNDLAATDYTRSKFDIIVVAEGAKREGGEESYLDKSTRRLGGIAYQVAADIAQHIDLEIRVTVLGHIQRGGSPVAFDRVLATRFGAAAGRLVQKGDFGKMVALRGEDIVAVPIRDAVAQMKYVDPNGPLVASARGVGISFGDGK
jgi:6-phosphofructokinase